jgi:hypothetical protein
MAVVDEKALSGPGLKMLLSLARAAMVTTASVSTVAISPELVRQPNGFLAMLCLHPDLKVGA